MLTTSCDIIPHSIRSLSRSVVAMRAVAQLSTGKHGKLRLESQSVASFGGDLKINLQFCVVVFKYGCEYKRNSQHTTNNYVLGTSLG